MESKDLPNNKEVDFSQVEFVICDWDGTLADSMTEYTASYSEILNKSYGIDQKKAAKFFIDHTGASLNFQFQEGVKQFAGKIISQQAVLSMEDEFWTNLKRFKPKALPESDEFLKKLKERGLKVVVWSGTRTDVLREGIRLLGFDSYVDFAIGNEPGSPTLVKGPGLLDIISDFFHIDPKTLAENALVVGDGSGDIEAGKAINARIAAFGDPEDPNLVEADFIFNDYNVLLNRLK